LYGVRIPVEAKYYFLSQKSPDRSWVPLIPLFKGFRGSFEGIKRQGSEVNYSPPSSAQVKNEWSYPSTPPTRLHGMDRENFILYLIFNKKDNFAHNIYSDHVFGMSLGINSYYFRERH
jgi:hypothetical protein